MVKGRNIKWREVFVFILAILWAIVIVSMNSKNESADSAPLNAIATLARSSQASNAANGSFELANRQSFGFFYDIPEENWKRLQSIFIEHENHRYPEMPFTYHPEAQEHQSLPEIYKNRNRFKGDSSYEAWYQNNYEPNFSCQFEKRVGLPMNGDGPKWICDPHRIVKLAEERKAKDPNHPGCVVYSVGSNGDFSFELGMQKEVGEGVCEFHIFDMGDYEKRKPAELKRAYYHRWGFKRQGGSAPKPQGKVGDNDKYLGLKDTIKELGHDKLDVIDIFKIDCEKCEWETYMDWIADDVPMLHQILVEVHSAPIDKALDFYDSIERAGYLRFHKEPNIQWGSNCIEYAFVRVDKSFMKGKKIES